MKADESKHTTIVIGDGAAIPRKKDRGLLNAWWISLGIAVFFIIFLPVYQPDPYWDALLFISDGIFVTFQVTVFSILGALVLGLITGLGRLSKNRVFSLIASTYVEIVRGIPLIVQLVYFYYALAKFLHLQGMVAAVMAMSICYGAYMGEVFRAGIDSIDKGQKEAARSLGFNGRQTMALVILPQAWRTILPPVGNEFIALLKDSSLISVVAIADIFRRGREFVAVDFTAFETYTMVALVYLIFTLILSKIVSIMEQRLSHYVD
ncbi:MAG: amino acid ABC transporter permease [Desulfovibrio sp.]|nr:MAG: amino acid ABC transporter permease [Desulfovibrio sp.]